MEHHASQLALIPGEGPRDVRDATEEGPQRVGGTEGAAPAAPVDKAPSSQPESGASPKISVLDPDLQEEVATELPKDKRESKDEETKHSAKDRKRENRRRITLERMSQGGLHLNDLLSDPTNVSTPVEAMRAIMTRGKEHGWTTSQLFGVFLEADSKEENIPFDHFQTGLRSLGLTIPEEDEREIFKTFDKDGSGTIELSEFIHWCLDIDSMAWKAERLRRTTAGNDGSGNGNGGQIGVDEAAAAMAGEVAQAQLPPERPRYPLGTLIYEGSKLFWRTGESLRIAMHENKDLNCVAISTMLEGGSEPYRVLQVDSRRIHVNGKDAILERIAEITEADKSAIQTLPEDARAKLFDKARASVLSDYLLARLKLTDGGNASGAGTDTTVMAAAASAAARLGLGEEETQKATNEQATTAAAAAAVGQDGDLLAATGENSSECAGSDSAAPVVKSDSIFPKGTPTPVLVKLPEDGSVISEDGREDGGGAGSLLMKEELVFSEVHTFSKHISYTDFERVEHLVSEGLKEGHKGIETAQKAQRRTHGSLENPHHKTASSRNSVKTLLSSSSTPTASISAVEPRSSTASATRSSTASATGQTRSSSSKSKTASGSSILPAADRVKRASGKTQRPSTGTTRRRSSKGTVTIPKRASGGGGESGGVKGKRVSEPTAGVKGGDNSGARAGNGTTRLSASLSRPTASSAEKNISRNSAGN